ncbi:hypothetical protein LTR29_003330 [Friedmanniomyces endolithicus]|uniref:Uncharacterized protein n=1 Tax=Friedmanniomyces endolithicus TaxID=329885 RepID=A0A4U0UR55_9PEZI|nr:hypothetical protein LTS09_008803 [Friedmanniomyces endolithicus]KAK0945238.1 hypothetical protein LTR29_003330 [Friedmanniomyces endolithicus]TKA38380.1 hypothetical protein B0A54_10671 [Friedmanniomyces endolithicus]
MLSTNLTAGMGTPRAAYIPPLQFFAFLATLTVHPHFTTRTYDVEKQTAADDALRYLQQVAKLVGPRNSGLVRAFRFVEAKKPTASRNKRAVTRNTTDTAEEEQEYDADSIRSRYATEESLWSKADDFWSVVGWAFNCSVVHPHRWRRWKVWLELVLDVLAADLESHAEDDTIAASLFARYLASVGERGRNTKRRLMRAILADGTQSSLAEFHEVWRDETRGPRTHKTQDANRQHKRQKLDLDNGDFGDYGDESSAEDSPAASNPRSRSSTAKPSRRDSGNDENSDDESPAPRDIPDEPLPGVAAYGGTPSLHLRTRLLALLVRLCALSPTTFLDTEDLFDIFTEFLRPLPLAIFSHFVCPARPYLDPDALSSMLQMLFRPLLVGSGAPVYDENIVTQEVFEECFAPFAAGGGGGVDNAKVSVMVESLLRLLWRNGGVVGRRSLREAVEKGVKVRREKVAWDGRRRTGFKALEEEEAGMVMEASAQRMMSVLDLLT